MKRDKALDATIRTYDRNLDAYLKRSEGVSMKTEIDKFIGYLSGKDVLSVGCGFGKDEAVFAARGIAITGIDLSSSMIEEAKKRVPSGEFYVMDMRSLEFADERFEGVYCRASIHHLARGDSPLALSEMYRVLKPGGVLFICVKEGSGEEFRTLGEGEVRETFYSKEEMGSLVKDTGLEIIEFYYTGNLTDKNPEKKPWLNYICRKR